MQSLLYTSCTLLNTGFCADPLFLLPNKGQDFTIISSCASGGRIIDGKAMCRTSREQVLTLKKVIGINHVSY